MTIRRLLLISYFYHTILKKIRLPCESKHNFNLENHIIFLMVTEGKKWHYLVVKTLSAFPRGITSNHNGYFYCLNCFIHIVQKINLKNIKEYVMMMIIITQKYLTKTTKY